jgi:hypothetical protein
MATDWYDMVINQKRILHFKLKIFQEWKTLGTMMRMEMLLWVARV